MQLSRDFYFRVMETSVPCLAVMQQLSNSNVLAVLIQVKFNILIQLFLLICQRGHIIVHARNQNLPPFVYQGACLGRDSPD